MERLLQVYIFFFIFEKKKQYNQSGKICDSFKISHFVNKMTDKIHEWNEEDKTSPKNSI